MRGSPFAAVWLLVPAITSAQEPAVVTTIDGERIEAGAIEIDPDQRLAVTPPGEERRVLELDAVERIDLPDPQPLADASAPGRVWLRSGVALPAAWAGGQGARARLEIDLGERGAPIELDLRHVAALRFGPADVDGGEAFDRAVETPPTTDDLLFAWNRRSGALTRLSVEVLGFDGQDVRVDFQGERTLPADQVHGIVMGRDRGTRPPPLERPLATVSLLDGPELRGRLAGFGAGVVELRLAEGPVLRLPRASVESIEVASSRVARLSAMEPTTVEQTPAFDRVRPWLRDRAVGGAGIELGGRRFGRGLCLVPRTVMTFPLHPGEFERFEALVGIDDRSDNHLAHAAVRIRLDDTVVLELDDVRHGAPPRPVSLPLGDARSLTLEVDFGANLDLGDHCVFAEPRLLKG